MNVILTAAKKEERGVLENLFQFYAYDFSEFMALDVEAGGRFNEQSFAPYWEDDWRFPFLLRVDEKWAGFALVHHRSRLSNDDATWDMAEFFVLRKYRRHGVGSTAARILFEKHRGPWEIRQTTANHAATVFWRKAVSTFSNGQFREVIVDDERWRGPVQSFVSGDRG